jgi:hypothetical protein
MGGSQTLSNALRTVILSFSHDRMVTYKLRNWRTYNKALVNRGDISLWFEEKELLSWYSTAEADGRGRKPTYSDNCIALILTLKEVFHLTYRAVQGFVRGLLKRNGIEFSVPDYSTLSRRAGVLKVSLRNTPKKVTDIVIDSTGLKIYGEGEWKMRTHGKGKRRTWRKLHIAVCPDTHMVIAHQLTLASVHDDSVLPELVKDVDEAKRIYTDGAYVSKMCFDAIVKTKAKAVIPIRSGTSKVQRNPSSGQQERNRLVDEIAKAGGRAQWKKTSGYHKRSLVETAMFRIKTIFGGKLANRTLKNQTTEAAIRLNALNKMTAYGMPESYAA